MSDHFKALRPDLGSFYDGGETKWKLGQPMPLLKGETGGPCGTGYHFGTTIEGAVKYAKFPFRLFEAAPSGTLLGKDDHKERWTGGMITKPVPLPSWAKRTEKFIASIPKVKWLDNHAKPRKAWRLFETRDSAWASAWYSARDSAWYSARDSAWDSARDSARDSAWASARDSAWYSARDSALMASMEIVSDLHIDAKHRKHARDRWEVWTRGYGLLCDVDGVLYVYKSLVARDLRPESGKEKA